MTQKTIVVLTADEGKVLNNGGLYLRKVFCEASKVSEWTEVDESERVVRNAPVTEEVTEETPAEDATASETAEAQVDAMTEEVTEEAPAGEEDGSQGND